MPIERIGSWGARFQRDALSLATLDDSLVEWMPERPRPAGALSPFYPAALPESRYTLYSARFGGCFGACGSASNTLSTCSRLISNPSE